MWRRKSADPGARAARTVTIVATVLFALVLCRWRPWDLFAHAGFSNDFYDEQARSFLRLRMSVRPEVPGPEGFLIDGRTYLYYGPFLALARLPFALFGSTFAGRLTRLSMIIGYVTLCTASFHLVEAARRWAAARWSASGWTGRADGGPSVWRTAGFVAAVACSPALFLAGWVSVYHETELWAAAFAAWALVGMLRLHLEPSRRHAVLAGAAIVAATLTRAPVGIGIAAGAGIVALAMWRHERANASIVIGSCIAGMAAHVAVNVAKFGTLLSLPADRQVLTLNDPSRAAWFAGNNGSFFSLRFLPTTIVQYLRPDTVRFERLVPLIRYGPLATDRGSYPMETITPSASLTNTATLLMIAAVIGLAALVARRAWAPLALFMGGAIAAVPTFAIGFIGNRYLVDMLPMLMLPAAFAFAAIVLPNRWSPTGIRRSARIVVGILVVWGTWSNVALATWTQNLKEPGFTEWRYRIDDVFFGDPAPALIVHDPDAPVARDGVVAVSQGDDAAQCNGVYIAEQGRWVALERSNNGVRRLRGTLGTGGLEAEGEIVVAGGPIGDDFTGWDLVLVAAPTPHLELRSIAFGTIIGAPIHLPGPNGGGTAGDGTAGVDIVRDEISGEFSVAIDGRNALFSFGAPTGPITPGSDLKIDHAPGDTLCRRLQARL